MKSRGFYHIINLGVEQWKIYEEHLKMLNSKNNLNDLAIIDHSR